MAMRALEFEIAIAPNLATAMPEYIRSIPTRGI